MACLFALLDQSTVVQADHLNAALALWDYLESSARFIFGGTLGDPDAEKLIAAVKAAPNGLTRNDIRTQVYHGHLPAARLAELLERLLNEGLVSRRTEATGGKPAERWFAGSDAARKGGRMRGKPPIMCGKPISAPPLPRHVAHYRAEQFLDSSWSQTPRNTISTPPLPRFTTLIAQCLEESGVMKTGYPPQPIYLYPFRGGSLRGCAVAAVSPHPDGGGEPR